MVTLWLQYIPISLLNKYSWNARYKISLNLVMLSAAMHLNHNLYELTKSMYKLNIKLICNLSGLLFSD